MRLAEEKAEAERRAKLEEAARELGEGMTSATFGPCERERLGLRAGAWSHVGRSCSRGGPTSEGRSRKVVREG